MQRYAYLAAGAIMIVAVSAATRAAETVVETFDDQSNEGSWWWGTNNEEIVELGGNPGAFLQDLTLSSCCPMASSGLGVQSEFTGNYRAMGVTSVGLDLITIDADFYQGGRMLTVMLFNDNDTPFNPNDDWGAYFVGELDVPLPGVCESPSPICWTSYEFTIDSQADEAPEGWVLFNANGGPAGVHWVNVVSDVDALGFNYGDPTLIYIFDGWDVGLDNVTITKETDEECEGDANGDGAVDPLDSGFVLARFGCPVGTGDASCDAADQNGDGAVDPLDSGFVLARFGQCL
ncbi:MAG: hypothetical protein IH988_10960 [Planctomycetes bacterium]|nr:hypothetical protein [Planctomycetota bacterium]